MSNAVATIKDVDEYGPVIDWHQHWSELKGRSLHLAQPAKAVDVGAIREVIADMRHPGYNNPPFVVAWVDKLTRALSGEKAGQWLDDAPTEGGWYWRLDGESYHMHFVFQRPGHTYMCVEGEPYGPAQNRHFTAIQKLRGKWWRVPLPSPPASPTPDNSHDR